MEHCMTEQSIYLDYAATTPVDPAVREAMFECLTLEGAFGNPASDHAPGRRARAVIDKARATVADRVGARTDGIVFTSGATEANSLALSGMFPWRLRAGAHLVTSVIEHHSVLETAERLRADGVDVSFVDCDARGFVDPDAIEAAIRPETRLVSIMHVNNEIGTVQDIPRIAAICRERRVPLHVDAAQSAGKVPLAIDDWGLALCSMTAHKLCGPKGVGALYVRPGLELTPLMFGGEQERRIRPGTQATHQIAGIGKAFELADADAEAGRVAALRDRLWDRLAGIPGAARNGDPGRSAPHILSVSFAGIDGESLRLALGDIAVSQGSACASDTPEPSHVLSALGFSDARANATIRFGLGRFTTAGEVDLTAERAQWAVQHLAGIAGRPPAWCSA
jgi:cysteine desulfurase